MNPSGMWEYGIAGSASAMVQTLNFDFAAMPLSCLMSCWKSGKWVNAATNILEREDDVTSMVQTSLYLLCSFTGYTNQFRNSDICYEWYIKSLIW